MTTRPLKPVTPCGGGKWTCARINRVSVQRRMLVGTQNHANLANSQKGGGGTDFSIAAIMARGPSSREPSERSSSKFKIKIALWSNTKSNNSVNRVNYDKANCDKVNLTLLKRVKNVSISLYFVEVPVWNQFASIKPSIFMVPVVLCEWLSIRLIKPGGARVAVA